MDFAALETFPHLETDRLILRRIETADAKALLKLLSDREVLKTTDAPQLENLEQANWLIEGLEGLFSTKAGIRWGITLKPKNTLIGTCGFNRFEYQHSHSGIGYELAKQYWGQGLMTEAVAAMVNYGFEALQLNRIEALTILDNIASIRVLQKLGFREEGILREYIYAHDRYNDVRIFSLLKREK
ncbi:MAG TPA: GNAT family protein [Chloroflexia bacterium]|nr:GNAT family protein [Chloroflexia bacterium]